MVGTAMKRNLALAALALMLFACGASPEARGSPSPSSTASPTSAPFQSPSPSPSPSLLPTPTPAPQVRAGGLAYVAVTVATGWHNWSSPRPIDRPALENPVRIDAWMAAMTNSAKEGLIGRVDTQVLLGEPVLVLSVQGAWTKVVVPDQRTPLDSRGYPVWIPLRQLTAIPPVDADRSLMVVKPTAVVRSADRKKTLRLSFGTVLSVLGENSTTYQVWVSAASMIVDKTAVSLKELPQSGASVVATARLFLGLQYLWGGTSGFGYDCSGLVYAVFKAHGLVLPRDADPQSRVGRAVSRASLQAGDLVFFSSGGSAYHVAIYAGGGMVIESPSPGYPVEQVPLSAFPIVGDYSGARRLLPTVTPSPSPAPKPGSLPASLAGTEWTKLPTTDKVVALTFDAGGNNAGVAPILKALADAGAPATFFLTGRWTEVYPNDARTIANSYAIGNHTYDHPHLTSLTDAQVASEVTRAQSVIVSTTKHDPRPLFRFPYGSVDARTLADVHRLGYGGIRWTVDTLGWEGKNLGQSTSTVIKRVLDALRPGEIVLMHVGAANDGSTLDAQALPALITELRSRGYRLVLVGSYL
jgi:Predicted xylanase/chitin deacetylase